MKHSIFISHASEDASLASAVQNLLESAIRSRRGERLVFRSTDIRAMEGGADWYAAIIEALRTSRVCLSLLTPVSVHKPWVMYESGGAYAVYRSRSQRFIPLCASGITPGLVPGPLQRLQARRLYDFEELEHLLKQIAKYLETSWTSSSKRTRAVANLAADPTGGWDSVQVSRVATRAELSPYRFDRALALARNHVFIAGQNLHTIASSGELRESILNFLAAAPETRRVDVLLCDPSNARAVKTWAEVSPEQPSIGYSYKQHLRLAVQEFAGLLNAARKRALKLNVKVLGLVPFGATVVDPESNSGVIAFQPTVNHGQKPGERPNFLLTKSANPEVFRYYWLNFRTALECGKDLTSTLRGQSNSKSNGRAGGAARHHRSGLARRSPQR